MGILEMEIERSNEEKKLKVNYQLNIDKKEIFLAKAFRCAFKIMDRLLMRTLEPYNNRKNNKKNQKKAKWVS